MQVASESFLSKWTRRGISLSVLAMATVILGGGAGLFIPMALIIDFLRGQRKKWPLLRAFTFFFIFCLSEWAGVLAAGLLWIGAGGGLWMSVETWQRLNTRLQHRWTSFVFDLGAVVFGYRVSIEGLDAARDTPHILLVRHQSTVDSVMASALILNPLKLELRCILKRELLWDPCLDIVGQRLNNAFISRQRDHYEADIQRISHLAETIGPDAVLLLFPEGTRYSRQKAIRRLAWVKKLERPRLLQLASEMQNLLPPKLGALRAMVVANPDLDLVFMAHRGLRGVSRFSDFLNGQLIGAHIEVKLWRVSAQDHGQTCLETLLFSEWVKMDRWVGGDEALKAAC